MIIYAVKVDTRTWFRFEYCFDYHDVNVKKVRRKLKRKKFKKSEKNKRVEDVYTVQLDNNGVKWIC